MRARSSARSNQRPDTLMQDRIRQIDEIPLHRTAGPYIWVIHEFTATASVPLTLCRPTSSFPMLRSWGRRRWLWQRRRIAHNRLARPMHADNIKCGGLNPAQLIKTRETARDAKIARHHARHQNHASIVGLRGADLRNPFRELPIVRRESRAPVEDIGGPEIGA